jgi:hypothetical protein
MTAAPFNAAGIMIMSPHYRSLRDAAMMSRIARRGLIRPHAEVMTESHAHARHA